eukprot:Blabericola_migrator_1__2464@NODE_1695_length_3984_cov_38_238958_g1098_i0_p3_GENE_NODE_1695_length_3984_cov_38_238958_g1098_i0NODE_1695_length_3984_cov_38_238958_g1098_i0_p3_ORF_typecomplete_len107_score7_77_NODE_1695_length_3984_cov_38_238958_g1098_i028723192
MGQQLLRVALRLLLERCDLVACHHCARAAASLTKPRLFYDDRLAARGRLKSAAPLAEGLKARLEGVFSEERKELGLAEASYLRPSACDLVPRRADPYLTGPHSEPP